jgi:hypothetical protein
MFLDVYELHQTQNAGAYNSNDFV